MKYQIGLAFVILIVVLLHSCSKQKSEINPSESDGSECPAREAQIDTMWRTDSHGKVSLVTFEYDALYRVTAVRSVDSIFTQLVSYDGSQTAYVMKYLYETWEYNFQARSHTNYFDALGKRTGELTIATIGSTHDTAAYSGSIAYYNVAGQLSAVQFIIYPYPLGTGTTQREDSIEYIWTDGNMTQANFYDSDGTLKSYGEYQYLSGSDGYFQYNTPSYCAFYKDYSINQPVLSKNLLSKYTLSTGEFVHYHYEMDSSQKVIQMIQVNAVSDTDRYRFKYQCR